MFYSRQDRRKKMETQLERVKAKIRRIVITSESIPHERLSKGREIRDLLTLGIKQLDEGDETGLGKTLKELKELGVL
ncbi:hypothetical protein [Algoriphagus sediminis]|uniref:Uncharacterized protein n=1 Tax=Algoriphagus sediminis TaxID=3057113 RepID=A0ABT7YGQ3_9BACT|nr:hypothetical protein [Algoriphagus sediminis]MDN3205661.1 hypothetical protein [Algoriphagus sediminis]